MVLDEALSGADRRDRRAADETLAQHRPRGGRGGQPQAGDDPRRRRGARAGRDRARASSCRPRRATARRSSCCRARRASCSRCGAAHGRATACAPCWRGPGLPAGDPAAVRHPRVGDRRDAARGRARRRRPVGARGHDLPETRRGRGRHPLRAGGRGRLPRLRRDRRASAMPRRCSPRTGARSIEIVAAMLRGEARDGGTLARSPQPSRARAGCWRRG